MPLDFPNTPSNGSTYTADGVTWQYDGEKWIIIGSGTDPVAVSASPPTSPGPGDAWFDTDSGTLLVYYDGFWVAPSVNYSIGTAAVGTTQIADKAVTSAKLALGPTYETALPASPVDGQEIYYAADATNGVIWHLRYRSGSSSSYKWEFIGGPPLTTTANGSATNSGTITGDTWGDVSTAISVTAPLEGDYFVSGSSAVLHSGAGGLIWLGIKKGATDDALNSVITLNGANTWSQLDVSGLLTGVGASAASKVITLRYKPQNTATNNLTRRGASLIIRPIRVG